MCKLFLPECALAYIVAELRAAMPLPSDEDRLIDERTEWMRMLEDDLDNGGGWD